MQRRKKSSRLNSELVEEMRKHVLAGNARMPRATIDSVTTHSDPGSSQQGAWKPRSVFLDRQCSDCLSLPNCVVFTNIFVWNNQMYCRQETDRLQEFILLFGTDAWSLAFIMRPCKMVSESAGLS
jgi:hypothetical protein